MLRIVLLAGVLTMALSQSSANILRVGIEYSSFDAAHTAASTGDTLQIYGSYSGTVSKRLVIMGFGYNFDVHPGLQAIGTESPSTLSITFQTGSDSTIAEGLDISAAIYVSKIIIRRCRGTMYIYNNQREVNDIRIIGCVFTGGGMVYSNFPCKNFLMYNTILAGSTLNMAPAGNGSNGAIINCTTYGLNVGYGDLLSLGTAGFLVKNCILYIYSGSNSNTVYENNFYSSAQPVPLPQGSNNRWGQSWINLFNRLGATGTGGATDNPGYYGYATFDEDYFMLKTGSAAINGGFDAANNPTDCGIFGGDALYRYRTSGVPAVPSFYKITAPGSAATTNPYNITISVRSNN